MSAQRARYDLATQGHSASSAKPGPERDLVGRFLADLPMPVPPGQRMTVFREPRLVSGAPDVVVVCWRKELADAWAPARELLSAHDVRLLHLLASFGPLGDAELLAFGESEPRRSLDRLADLKLVRRLASSRWLATPVCRTFAVRRIVAFEAKMSDWSRAVEQAALNRWFASESYVLVPNVPRSPSLVELAEAADVGVWVEGSARPLLRAPRNTGRQPISYASWLFNEWALRADRSSGADA